MGKRNKGTKGKCIKGTRERKGNGNKGRVRSKGNEKIE